MKLKFLLILGHKYGLNGMKGMRLGGKSVKKTMKNQNLNVRCGLGLTVIKLDCISKV